jgi:hypothetical protein
MVNAFTGLLRGIVNILDPFAITTCLLCRRTRNPALFKRTDRVEVIYAWDLSH